MIPSDIPVLIRLRSGSLSLSDDETMIAANNTHNGFNLYSLPHGTPISHFVEHNLYPTATSDFFSFDRFFVHPGGAGVLKLWDIPSKFSLASVGGTCEPFRATPLPLTLKHSPKVTTNRGSLQLRWIDRRLRRLGLTLQLGSLV